MRAIVEDLVRRRLWPIPLAAVLVAIAAPLLFLRGSDEGGSASPAPAPSAQSGGDASGPLPEGTDRLLQGKERKDSGRGRGRDPFQPPSAQRGSADTSSTPSRKAAAKRTPQIKLSVVDGTKPSTSTGSRGSVPNPKRPKTRTRRARPAPSTPRRRPTIVRSTTVDVRFGKTGGEAQLRRSVGRSEVFEARGAPIASFVKYSPSLRKAVFALPAGTLVTGPLKCRRVQGACRFVDIPDGSYARLVMRHPDGGILIRRIDVEIHAANVRSASR